jgi:hypothetical protein
VLAANIFIRFRQRNEAAVFFTQENLRLMEVQGKDGPRKYIKERLGELSTIRNPDIRLAADLNMSTVMLADTDYKRAGEILSSINPAKIDDDALLLVYWTQSLLCAIQAGDDQKAAQAYANAGSLIPDVNEALQNSFKPACIQYLLYAGEGESAMEMLDDIPLEELDDTGRDQLDALRAYGLWITGREEEARNLAAFVRIHNILPSTAWWLEKIPKES